MRVAVRIVMCGVLAVWSATPTAQPYPAKPVRMVVAYPAGGSIDTTARLVAPRLAEIFGQPFIIDNRSGAAGNIGTDFVAKSSRWPEPIRGSARSG
jgi:tripartite-type tricarboxylate transporter receptor subunit TctC